MKLQHFQFVAISSKFLFVSPSEKKMQQNEKTRHNYVISIIHFHWLKKYMLQKIMLQMWGHVFFYTFFSKFLFSLKKCFSNKNKNSNRFEILILLLKHFFAIKCCATKKIVPGDTLWNCNNLEILLQIHEKFALPPLLNVWQIMRIIFLNLIHVVKCVQLC